MDNIIVYSSGEIELKISVKENNIWLTQSQISELFTTSSDNIGLHFKNIYKEKELIENSTTEDISVVRQEGNRKVKRQLKHYNLEYNQGIFYDGQTFDASHDRFLIIDEKEVYHIGASLKDLGKKWFGFSKMDSESFEMMGRLR